MRKLFYYTVFILSTTFLSAEIKITLHDSLEPLYPDTEVKTELRSINLNAPRNSFISTDLFFQNLTKYTHLNFHVKSNVPVLSNPKVFELIDVPLEINTGIESRTEKWDKKTNPHVIRRAPFRIYEVLKPIGYPVITTKKALAIRFMWNIPQDIKPGEYDLEITLKEITFVKTVNVKITIHDTTLPEAGKESFGYTNWFNPSKIAEYHKELIWDSVFWDLLKEYANLMHHGRQNMFWVRWNDFFSEVDGKLVLNKERLERYLHLFTSAGIYYIEFSPIAHRTNGNWGSKTLSLFHKEILISTEEGEKLATSAMTQVKELLEENEWLDRCRFHIADEPTDTLVDDYKKAATLLKSVFPNSKIIEATMTRKLEDAVDIWCPQLQKFQKHQQFFEDQRKKGDEIWVYSCLVPGGKWLNRLIDQERLRPVYIGWSLAKYDLGGFLHWGLNHWGADPFKQSVIDHFAAQGTNNQLPAGDTHVFYPGEHEPWSSTRFEAHRVGLEDAELFRILKKKDAKLAETIMSKAFRAYDDYDISVTNYRKIRAELLSATDQLNKSAATPTETESEPKEVK